MGHVGIWAKSVPGREDRSAKALRRVPRTGQVEQAQEGLWRTVGVGADHMGPWRHCSLWIII